MLTCFFASNCWFAAEVPTAMLVDKNVTRYPPLGTHVNSAKKICIVLFKQTWSLFPVVANQKYV